jgi:hypothetical protein
MNLPDDIKKNAASGHKMKTNQEIIAEAQKKKEALAKVNNKFNQDIS